MKKYMFLIGVLFSFPVAADMKPVTSQSSALVKEFASGICSIGNNQDGTDCCTGFRIADDLIMTNFHCLACVHGLFRALHGETPRMMEPSHFLYSLPSKNQEVLDKVVKVLKEEKKISLDYSRFYLPNSDSEFKTLMNSYPELFTRINFGNTVDHHGSLSGSAVQIQEIVAMNLQHDYSILRVKGISSNQKIFKLDGMELRSGQSLAIIGHPSKGPYPNKKVYDLSKDCQVLEPEYTTIQDTRKNVFSHACDTAPGSSGSPVIDRFTGHVVGLHWGANYDAEVRMGIDMKSILPEIRFAVPELLN